MTREAKFDFTIRLGQSPAREAIGHSPPRGLPTCFFMMDTDHTNESGVLSGALVPLTGWFFSGLLLAQKIPQTSVHWQDISRKTFVLFEIKSVKSFGEGPS
jgi:hypothetical protein